MTDIVAQIMDCCEQVIKRTGRYYCTLYIKDIALTVYRLPQGSFVNHILFRADDLMLPSPSPNLLVCWNQLQPVHNRMILYADPRLFELILEALDGGTDHL